MKRIFSFLDTERLLFASIWLAGLLILLADIGWGQNPVPKPGVQKKQTATHANQKEYLYFDHILVYEYTEGGKTQEFWIYVNPKSGNFLFSREDTYHATDEMNDFAIAFPNGEYWFCGIADETGKKARIVVKTQDDIPNAIVKPTAEEKQAQQQAFAQQARPTGRTHSAGPWTAREYRLQMQKTTETTLISVATVPFGVYPLYNFNDLNADAKLPGFSRMTTLLATNQLLVAEQGTKAVRTENGTVHMVSYQLQLKAYEPNAYYAYYNRYQLQKGASYKNPD
jgi:hypothetical protein